MYQLPACFPYIKACNEVDFNLYYSVWYQAYHKKYPKKEIQEKELQEALVQSGYAAADSTFKLIESINCFELSKTYQCHFICQLCPYYPTYRNQKESEEKVLLSYMAMSYSNTKVLLDLGFDHTLFTSLYFIQEEKPILFPLHSIFFEYLQTKVKKDMDFQQLPQQFIDDFSVLHPDKIKEETTYQTIKNYILQLQNRPYDEQTFLHALQSYSEDYIKKFTRFNAKKRDTEAKNVPIEKEEKRRSGLLLNETRKEQNAPVKKLEQKEKKKEEKKVTNSLKEKKETLPCSILAPTEFAFHQYKPIIWIEHQTPSFLQVLQKKFLLYPILPLELLTDIENQRDYFLFYLKESFYAISADSKLFLTWLKQYTSISRFRTILSYSPYRLFHYFIKNKLSTKTIFPIHAAYELLPDSVVTKTPFAVLKQLISKESNSSPFFLFALPHYELVWKNIMKQLEKENDVGMKIKQKIKKELFFSSSFELSDYTNQKGFLFTKNGNGFHFTTLNSSNLNKNYIYHQFLFDYHKSNEKEEMGWIEELIQIIADEFLYQNHFYLLSFHTDTLTLAINKESTVQIVEKINTIATYLAEQRKNLPITITCYVRS